MDWESLVKRYVYDPAKTPYFTAVARLSRKQARSELFAYTLLLGVLMAAVSIVSLSPSLPHGEAIGVPIYAFAVAAAALILGLTKHITAAALCATAPIATLLYFAFYGFQPALSTGDRLILVAASLLWLRYAWRTLRIVRHYPNLPFEGRS